MKNIHLLLATIFGTLLMIAGVVFLFSGGNQQLAEVDQALLVGDARLATGAADAKVTIVEFSDLECPACKASQPLVEYLLATYPDDVRVVFRHFPLNNIHPNAQLAAQAAEIAHTEGQFWPFISNLYARQDDWASLRGEEFRNKLASYATELGIDNQQFLDKIDNEEVRENVLDDLSLGTQVKVNATPTFFVNGKNTPAPQLMSAVQSLLAN